MHFIIQVQRNMEIEKKGWTLVTYIHVVFGPVTDFTILISTLDRGPEHVREPQESRREEHEARGEAVVEPATDIVDLDGVVLPRFEEGYKSKNRVEQVHHFIIK